MTRRASRAVVDLDVEEAMGPGLDLERGPDGRGLVARRARQHGVWLGVDRAGLIESDDGRGRRQGVLVALPSSSFVGCRIEAELVGGFDERPAPVLVARLSGASLPIEPLLRTAGRISPGSAWFGAEEALRAATTARRRFRERRGQSRVTGGIAWQPPEELSHELVRQSSIHSRAEQSLRTLPPRFLRGLEGILDADERLLYSIERPWRGDPGVLERVRHGIDRRSALLLLTDRQLLWIADHANPDSFLSDWGVDLEVLPLEQLTDVRIAGSGPDVTLVVSAGAGPWHARMPRELEHDLGVMETLVRRFLPGNPRPLPRRTYELTSTAFRIETADLFHQGTEARSLLAEARVAAGAEPRVFLFSPRREGQRDRFGLYVTDESVGVVGSSARRLTIDELSGIGLVLSPLVGRITLRTASGDVHFTYPAPLAADGAATVRLLRRIWANRSQASAAGRIEVAAAPGAAPHAHASRRDGEAMEGAS